jgi:hypothetical protein
VGYGFGVRTLSLGEHGVDFSASKHYGASDQAVDVIYEFSYLKPDKPPGLLFSYTAGTGEISYTLRVVEGSDGEASAYLHFAWRDNEPYEMGFGFNGEGRLVESSQKSNQHLKAQEVPNPQAALNKLIGQQPILGSRASLRALFDTLVTASMKNQLVPLSSLCWAAQ